tara:strand:+ start:112 stop:807 length:696 start_codon:yes stop_codon:yes gene_type:complete
LNLLDNKLFKSVKSVIEREGNGFYGLIGGAGVGKSTLANKLKEKLNYEVYSSDYRFIGDSLFRKQLLYKKQNKNIDTYIDAINQFNWWDWVSIERDLELLRQRKSVLIKNAYDRTKGNNYNKIVLHHENVTLLEGAILGDITILNKLKKIIFLWGSPNYRFNNILKKDINRRSFNEICARYLITEYSENLYYSKLFTLVKDKLVFFNVEIGDPINEPLLEDNLYIPLKCSS